MDGIKKVLRTKSQEPGLDGHSLKSFSSGKDIKSFSNKIK